MTTTVDAENLWSELIDLDNDSAAARLTPLLAAQETQKRVEALAAEFDARAEAAKHQSTVTAGDEDEALVEWGRHYGYASAAKMLREAIQ